MAKFLFSAGEKNREALLHEEDVRAIYEWRILLGLDGAFLAEHFGISESAVSAIIHGHTWKHLNLPPVTIESMRIADFWRFVSKQGPDDCWNWLGKLNRDTGYGRFCRDGQVIGAHRYSYELHKGPVPEGLFVVHSCDNRRCVNPAHLSAKTPKQNVEEMWERGRACPPPIVPRPGEANYSAKVTEAQVAQMRAERKAGDPLKVLAQRYHMNESAISRICNGVRWKHSYASA